MTVAHALGLRPPRTSAFARANAWLAATRPGAKAFAVAMPALDAAVRRLSGGRTTFAELMAGLPTVYVTTRGARTGLPRTVPLLATVLDGAVVLVGSNWGARTHPGWVHNLAAHPQATVEYAGRTADVLARELSGAEAERAWSAARALYRGYAVYPERTGGRVIRLFALEPVDPAAG